jgi:hypothetical protein
MLEQCRSAAIERLERNGLMVRGSSLPTPKEHAEPLERQGAYGRLVCFARLALLLVIDPCPEGMVDRCRGPLHEGLAEAWRTVEAPVDPGLLAAPFGHRCDARELLECSGGGIAFPWFAEGDEEAGSDDGASAWKGLEQGAVGMALGALRDGLVAVLDGVQGDPELADAGLHESRRGGDDALIGGQGGGSLDGVDALGHHVRGADVVRAKAGLQGRATREWHRFEGGPAPENVTQQQRVGVLKPWESLRERVFQGARETVGEPHLVPDHAATVCDELFQGAHGRALWAAGRPLVAVGAQQVERECRVGGVILRAAGGKRFAVAREGQWIDGQEDEDVVCAQGTDDGPLVECEADGEWLAGEPLAHGSHPGLHGCWRVLEDAVLSCCGARRLSAHSMCGISPVEADKGRTCLVRFWLHEGSPRVW